MNAGKVDNKVARGLFVVARSLDHGWPYFLCLLLLFAAQVTNLIFENKYQQYRFLAESLLAGRLDFVQMPGISWDDTALFDGAYYWPLGAFPSVLLMPLVFISGLFDVEFSQGYLVFPLAIWTFLLVVWLAKKFGREGAERIWIALAFVGSSSYLAIALVPWSWHLAHIVAVWLLLIAIHEYLGQRRWAFIGLILGLIYASRPTAALSILFFSGALLGGDYSRRTKIMNNMHFFGCFLTIALLVMWYNAARFGSPFENGYNYQVGVKPDGPLIGPWNIPTNLRVFLIGLPIQIDGFPFFAADPFGMSVLVVSPWLLLVRPQRWNWQDSLLMGNMVVVILFLLCWWSTGSNQMGYRFSLDFLPLLFWLLLRTNAIWVHRLFKIAVSVSVLLNFYFLTTVFNR
jgi:hypothetical protein